MSVELILFALTLLGVALFHRRTMLVALVGLFAIAAWKSTQGFDLLRHFVHFEAKADGTRGLGGEWVLLLDLFGLLLGFALLADYFARSRVPDVLPRILPDDWKGCFVLLVLVFALSTFLDNIAAAMIGGTIAAVVFKQRVHVGYLAAIVAAGNAGGAGSVLGDTTTTMLWVAGVRAREVLEAFIPSATALLVFGVIASRQQDRYQRIAADPDPGVRIDWPSLLIAMLIPALAVAASLRFEFPAAGVWLAILLGARFRRPAWGELAGAAKGAVFLLALVACASLMPVDSLPAASWRTTLGLGFVSAVFDNIPLTKLALDQGGYDWGFLAYAVGFGGSMTWFGSTAGVALASSYPEAKSLVRWVRDGWHVALGYVVGYAALLAALGWHPSGVPR